MKSRHATILASLTLVVLALAACDNEPRRFLANTSRPKVAPPTETPAATEIPDTAQVATTKPEAGDRTVPKAKTDAPADAAADLAGSIKRGKRLFKRKKCTFCHDAKKSYRPKSGPNLLGVGGRIARPDMIIWIEDPKAKKPDTKMPVFKGKPKELEDITNFLMSLK